MSTTAPPATLALNTLKGPVEPVTGNLPDRSFRKSSSEVAAGGKPGLVVDVTASPAPNEDEKVEMYRESALRKIFTSEQLKNADVRGQDLSMCTCVVGDYEEFGAVLLKSGDDLPGMAAAIWAAGREGLSLPSDLQELYNRVSNVSNVTEAEALTAIEIDLADQHPAFQVPKVSIWEQIGSAKLVGDLLEDNLDATTGAFKDKTEIFKILDGTYYDDNTVFHLRDETNQKIHAALKALSDAVDEIDEIEVKVTYRGMSNFSTPLNKDDVPSRNSLATPIAARFPLHKSNIDPVQLAALAQDYVSSVSELDNEKKFVPRPDKEVKVKGVVIPLVADFGDRRGDEFKEWIPGPEERQTVSIKGISSVGYDRNKGPVWIVENEEGKREYVRFSKIHQVGDIDEDFPKDLKRFLEELLKPSPSLCHVVRKNSASPGTGTTPPGGAPGQAPSPQGNRRVTPPAGGPGQVPTPGTGTN